MIITALASLLCIQTIAQVSPQVVKQLSPPCLTRSAANNTTTGPPYLRGSQFVPVGAGWPEGYFVTYSTKVGLQGNAECSKRTNNSLISVFELLPDGMNPGPRILLFGTGYGDRTRTSSGCEGAEFGPASDADSVSRLVRGCMGLVGTVGVQVVVPHAHIDHINPEFLHELEKLDFLVEAIWVHQDDLALTLAIADQGVPGVNCKNCNWIPDEGFEGRDLTPLIVGYGVGNGCQQPMNWCIESLVESVTAPYMHPSFDTTVGQVWIREREGHTMGSIDLVIDSAFREGERYLLRGSLASGASTLTVGCQPSTQCPPLMGVAQTIDLHGNVLLR